MISRRSFLKSTAMAAVAAAVVPQVAEAVVVPRRIRLLLIEGISIRYGKSVHRSRIAGGYRYSLVPDSDYVEFVYGPSVFPVAFEGGQVINVFDHLKILNSRGSRARAQVIGHGFSLEPCDRRGEFQVTFTPGFVPVQWPVGGEVSSFAGDLWGGPCVWRPL